MNQPDNDYNKDIAEGVRFIKRWLAIQRFATGLAYTTALAMLLCALASAQAHDISSAIIQGGLGTFNCYLGDNGRRRCVDTNKIYKAIKAAQKDPNKLQEAIDKIDEFLKKNIQNTK